MNRFVLERLAFPWQEPRDPAPRPPVGYWGKYGYHGPPSPPPWVRLALTNEFNQGEAYACRS